MTSEVMVHATSPPTVRRMNLVHLIVALAVVQALVFGAIVGRARVRYGVLAPATTGHAHFERLHRVHGNTIEMLVLLVPAMWMAASYWSPPVVAGLGAVYLLGRILYFRAYVANPDGRAASFVVSMLPVALLALATCVGAVRSMVG
jgi:glutathione S-transferase